MKKDVKRAAASCLLMVLVVSLFVIFSACTVDRTKTEDDKFSLADGIYTPDRFSFSGGSGKVKITCDQIQIENGLSYARITFNSLYYQQVKAGEEIITDYSRDSSSTSFLIPVKLNQENEILATTTKMSQPHEIAYSIYIELDPSLSGSGSSSGRSSLDSDESLQTAETAALQETSLSSEAEAEIKNQEMQGPVNDIQIAGLSYVSEMQLDYADCFSVYYYQDGYKLIDIPVSGKYLIVPEGAKVPDDLNPEIVVIRQPLEQIYLAATGAMTFIDRLGAISQVTMSSLDESGWAIPAPREAMKAGTMVYAGKYSEPDYEMMVQKDCDLALESTMILHTPEVQEMIEDLGIPVMIDRSSYEKEVLGRIEWIKMYGALLDREDLALEAFNSQKEIVKSLDEFENTEKTVAFFSVNSDRSVVVRKGKDIIANMISLAGGVYAFNDLDDPSTNSASMNLSMEDFYNRAVDADYLIYNGTITGALETLDDLLGKDELFAEFRAVQEGNVWTLDKAWYQDTANAANLIMDMHIMLTDGDPSGLTYMKKITE